MKIVINSHKNSTIALTHLLDSMQKCSEYTMFDITVIIGGFYEKNQYEIIKDKNITYIYCNFNSIDFTGLIALYELYSINVDEKYFYMHDTCKVGPTFFQKLTTIDVSNCLSVRINAGPSMNIGIYSQKLINKLGGFLVGYKNTREEKCMEYKVRCIRDEDYLFRQDNTNYVLKNYNNHGAHTGPTDYYNTGTLRIVEYYENIDLYKIKANWFHGNNTLKN